MNNNIIIVDKPWGHEEWWAVTDKYVGKLLYIKDGHRLSLQYHNVKMETMRVISGNLTFILDDKTYEMKEGDSIHVNPKSIHRMEARKGDVQIIEVSTCEVNDVIRVEDDYKRTK